MSKVKINFEANGRAVSASERAAMRAFEQRHGITGNLPSDEETRARMAELKAAALAAQRNVNAVESARRVSALASVLDKATGEKAAAPLRRTPHNAEASAVGGKTIARGKRAA